MTPYWQTHFFSFCLLFFERLGLLLTGKLKFTELASDEIQIFTLISISIACALVGTFMVLKKTTMLANSLSHTLLMGIAIAYILSGTLFDLKIVLPICLVCALLTSVLTYWLTEVIHLQEDASIGLVFTALFALGVLLVTVYARNAHISTEAIMGNVDALNVDDLKFAAFILLMNTIIVLLFWKQFTLSAFDAGFASSIGFSSSAANLLLMFLASCSAVGAFRAVGVLLFLALLVGPVVSARLLTHRVAFLIPLSAAIGSLASFLAVAAARHLLTVYNVSLSTSGLVVFFITLLFALCCAIWGWRRRLPISLGRIDN